MSKSLFLFFSFCSIYLILLFLGDFEINFSSFFLGNALQNKTLIFMLIGIGIFWSGKEVIDEKEGESNSILILFLLSFGVITIYEIGSFILKQNIFSIDAMKNGFIILTISLGALSLYKKRGIFIETDVVKNISFLNESKIIQILYTIIIIISGAIIILIAKNQAIHIDDMYTYSAIKGYAMYGENKLNILGLYYEYPLIYLYLTSKLYNIGILLGFSETLSLRLFNIILTLIFIIINLFFLSLYQISGKIKLLIFTLIAINIPIISTMLIARLYPINIIFIIISFFLTLQLIQSNEIKTKLYYFIGVFILGIFSWFFHPVNTIHILTLSIILFGYLIYILIKKYKLKGLKYIFIIVVTTIISIALLLFFRPNIIFYIKNIALGNEKVPIINYFQALLTFFQGINLILIAIVLLCLITLIFYKNKSINNKLFISFNLIFIGLSYLIHKELLGDRTDNIRYMIDVSYIFLIIFLYGIFYGIKILGKIPYYIILSVFLSLYFFHNINFGIKTFNKTFSYFQMRNFGLQEKFYLDNNKFNGETLITDLYLPEIEKFNTIYFISSTKNSNLRSVNNLHTGYYENKENYNTNYINQHFPNGRYVYDQNQDFMELNGFLSVMNTEHLKNIIKKDGIIHILVGFTFFDNWHIDKEKTELRNYILNNCDEKELITTKNELYVNTPIFWKHNDQLMFYCKIKKSVNL